MASAEWDLPLEVYARLCVPHLDSLAEEFAHLLGVHALFHILGAEDSQAHHSCMERLTQVEDDLTKARAAVWN